MKKSIIVSIVFFCFIGFAEAAEHIVKMVEKGDRHYKQFMPELLYIDPGDTVTFVVTEGSAHNSQTIEGMIPSGAKGWKSKIDQNVTVTLELEGVYGYKCFNHYVMGMIGVIVVGDPSVNLEEAVKVPHSGLAKKYFDAVFEEIKAKKQGK